MHIWAKVGLLRAHVKLPRAHVKCITFAREVITCTSGKFSFLFHHVPLRAAYKMENE